jgi:TetR/AcrR family transcriptional repressor of nem operon
MPRPANSDARRRLLDAGLALLHRNGFNAAGVKDLVDAAGVPKGSFYAYFSSKEQYACALVTEYWERIERAHASVLNDESIEPIQRLVAFFRALTDDHAGRDFVVGCLIGNLTRWRPICAWRLIFASSSSRASRSPSSVTPPPGPACPKATATSLR